ncbi:Abi family protein [Paraburkholderia sp. GAS334]|uniref:Abi family protein n=1 Tax=Paraburkholderia sp. GAS334 TaxID=3035131 RepID=UPI003D1E90D0
MTLQRLWDRNLRIDDRPANRRALVSIGYYRLLIYMRRFQNPATKRFRFGTRFSDVVALYDFDRHLRSVTMDAIERIEVALRSALSNPLAQTHGSHWYADKSLFTDIRAYTGVLSTVSRECSEKKGPGLTHYYETYVQPDLPPTWLVCEHLSLGALSRMFDALSVAHRKTVARHVWSEVPDAVLVSWLRSLTVLRNACAHHARLWDMKLTVSAPVTPGATGPLGRYSPGMKNNTTFYARATMMKALLDPLGYGAAWREALARCVNSCRFFDAGQHLGFPKEWEKTATWS